MRGQFRASVQKARAHPSKGGGLSREPWRSLETVQERMLVRRQGCQFGANRLRRGKQQSGHRQQRGRVHTGVSAHMSEGLGGIIQMQITVRVGSMVCATAVVVVVVVVVMRGSLEMQELMQVIVRIGQDKASPCKRQRLPAHAQCEDDGDDPTKHGPQSNRAVWIFAGRQMTSESPESWHLYPIKSPPG